MKTAAISIKTDAKTKVRARRVAEELGFSLSTLLNAYMKMLVRTRGVCFSTYSKEDPSEYMLETLAESEEDVKKGRVSPSLSDIRR